MLRKFFKFLVPTIFILISVVFVFGQEDKNNNKEDLPDGIKENLAKRRIKQDEADFQELVKRSEEAVQISEELNKSFENNQKLSSDDSKKLEKLEKVVKKIRNELGAEDDDKDNNDDKPTTLSLTLKNIKEKTTDLLAELKKTGRFAISVAAVESSNAIFRLVKILRFNKTN